ncbi:Phage DNA Packaging Protein [Parvularcula bermudensis HTCC2503]|uniref:Phage DNA Packaging Protein n=1 Tax=Parvularcula bermudensis (strain ATCC BAA-594 / HTCC2503 / KCTC 12087) TaxID=314260 RepID=E0TH83_PARBH|nr:terminase family protein [Parvularcula bermudensis]ADM09667.1 Phage DNA Packaging Protein [Parvularcula bermudensis HTCC2503]
MRSVLEGKSFLEGLSSTELKRALHEWKFYARQDQWNPPGDWTTWLVLGGRGAGKTRTGAEWIAAQIAAGRRRIALVGETYEDAREVMIDGPSGLCAIGTADSRPHYESSRHRLLWPCGAEAHIFSADDPDGLRGHQFEAAWSDELAKWRQPEAAWANLQLGLRLGDRPRQIVTTTPRPFPLLRLLMNDDRTVVTHAATTANRAALAETFLTEVTRTYQGTRLGRQELEGEVLDDREGALWSWSMIEASRLAGAPRCDRVVVAVDPPVTAGPDADECGIIVAGRIEGIEPEAVAILHDGSLAGASPRAWAEAVVTLASRFEADRVVAEVNQGGDLVEEMLRLADPNLSYRSVRATRGKIVRAEPVAALYEQGRVKHAAPFPVLEDQMIGFSGQGGQGSPDRLDALVWAVTDLLLTPRPSFPSIRTI